MNKIASILLGAALAAGMVWAGPVAKIGDWNGAPAILVDGKPVPPMAVTLAYTSEDRAVEKKGVSNCPLCAVGHAANRLRIYKFAEMDADHVTAWTKGGATDISNCQMLCKTHNRAKGNR